MVYVEYIREEENACRISKRVRGKENSYRILVRKSESKKLLGKNRYA
jgi:hypothetical protein